jgi:hypothetical protein
VTLVSVVGLTVEFISEGSGGCCCITCTIPDSEYAPKLGVALHPHAWDLPYVKMMDKIQC